MSEKLSDCYWMRMASNSVEAISGTLRPDLTTRRRELLIEYFARVFEHVYGMGMRLGELNEQIKELDER